MCALKVVLADDEPLAMDRLRELLQAIPDLEILAECGDGLQTLSALQTHKPDLLFLDIQMPELDGFEVLEALDPEAMPLVIFATAYDRYALRAFESRALDYLLKPFSRARLQEAVERARQSLEQRRAFEQRDQIQGLLRTVADRPRAERLLVRQGDRALLLHPREVEAVEAEANYMWVYRGQEGYVMRGTLAELEQRLQPFGFMRTHRSWILNPSLARELAPGTKGGLTVITVGGVKVPCTATQRKELEARLGT